jgi:rubredoxin
VQQPPIGPRRQKPKADEYEELGSADVEPNAAYEIWPGSWLCVDCGWEYTTKAFGTPLELQPESFRCPQCGARKRRFAKKLGSKVAITRDTSNLPIFVMSFLGLLAVIAFGVWAANKL